MKHKTKRYTAMFMIVIMLMSLLPTFLVRQTVKAEENEGQASATEEIPENTLRVHYETGDNDFTGLGVWFWGDVVTKSEDAGVWPDAATAFSEGGTTDYGAFVDIDLVEGASNVGMLVNNSAGDDLTGEVAVELLSEDMTEVWLSEEGEVSLVEPAEIPENTVRIHYDREDKSYEPWGIWAWGAAAGTFTEWPQDAQPFSNEQTGKYGAYVDLDLVEAAQEIGFLVVNREDGTDQSDDMSFDGLENHDQIFIRDGDAEVYTNPYFVATVEEVEYKDGEFDLSVTGDVGSSLHYNENAVLSVQIENNDNVGIEAIYADLSELGGTSKREIKTDSKEVSISVRHDMAPGEKEIAITVVDEDFGTYTGTAMVNVEARGDKNGDFDWDEAMIYFMLTDRFADGNPDNNDPYGIGYENYENDRGTYQGGDFAGITQNLDYLEDLGINTIWINPIVENVGHDVSFDSEDDAYFSYHGYWASDFEKLNPHLGTLAEFHELIDEAADRNMKIMVDVVLNHPGYGVNVLPEGEEPVGYPTAEDRDRFEGMIRQESGSNDLTMELSGLPDFLTEDPSVRDTLIDWQTSWLERSTTPAGNSIDYFRVDTVKHVDDTTWQQFKNELTKEMPSFKMIGESWGADQNDDQGYLNSGTMDSLLDFGFKTSAKDFVQGQLESVNADLEERNAGLDNTATLGQFLGSHDEPGFLSHEVDGNEGMLKVAAALQITAKGQPVIYYGEELGHSGANNWPYYDNRYDLDWENVEGNEILAHYQKVLAFRGEHSETFARGERSHISGSDEEKFLLFDRTYKYDSVYVGLNVSEAEQQVTVNVDAEGVIVTNHYDGQTYETNSEREVKIPMPAMADGGTVLLTAAGGNILGAGEEGAGDEEDEVVGDDSLRVHYETESNDFSDLGLWIWGDVQQPSNSENWPLDSMPFSEGGTTDYGAYVDVELIEDATRMNLLVNNPAGDNLTGDVSLKLLSPDMDEIWLSEEGDVSFIEPVDLPDNTVRVHYEKEDQAYEPWRVWTWGDVLEATTDWPTGAHPFSDDQVGKHGAFIDLELIENAEEINFLFLNPDTGDQTDDMTFSGLQETDHIFVREGDLTVYSNPYYVLEEGLESGELLSKEQMELRFSSTEKFSQEELTDRVQIQDKDGADVAFDSLVKNDDQKTVTIKGSFDVEATPYDVTFIDNSISVKEGWRFKDDLYAYEGDLGVELHEDDSATLKVWSPSADSVSIVLYDRDDQYEVVQDDVQMTRGDRGVWEVTLDEANTGVADLTGYYYHYNIERDGESVLALDPYASSMATWDSADVDNVPIGKAAIVDPSEIGPELEFAEIDGFEKREDAIIYEIHVRDFTSDPDIDEELEAQFGTFASFVEKLDYIEDLGVTHVQMLPVMSYFFADEFNNGERMLDYDSTDNNYNWGYDPHSYFSLTGMYSEDPDDAKKRIEEFKMLVDEIHARGMGVVLDVVYNHTAQEAIFENLEPEYYHFMNADGTSRTSFGGGRLGTTHDMSRRILVDSIMHWVEEYKVDGFRFDMMGDHDAESIQIAYDKAKEANPNIVMIGEGWRTFAGDENGGDVVPADQDWMAQTESVGSFSDEFRNELKSGFGSEGQPRFLTGGARSIQQIFDNVTANPHNFTATNPGDVVPYIAAHDNLTLHDVIAQSIKKDPAHHEEEIHQRIRLGNVMLLTSQGTPFIHAGQEFGRTKQFRADTIEAPYKSTYMESEDGTPFEYPYFIHDSYDSTDAINMFDWDKATDEEAFPISNQTREYTTGLIELRRSTDAFRLGTIDEIEDNVSLIDAPEMKEEDLILGFKAVSSDDSETYFVFVNTDNQERTLTLEDDLTQGTVLVDGNESGLKKVKDPSGFELSSDQIKIDPLTAVVVKKEAKKTSPPQADDQGKIEVSIGQADKKVMIPAHAAAINGKNRVVIERDDFSMEVPGSVLESLRALNETDKNAQISIDFAQKSTESISSILDEQSASQHAKIRSAGDVFDFSLSIIGSDGNTKTLDRFEEPIRIKLKVNTKTNSDLSGIYKVHEDGELKYVGGDVD
ncbi:pullulanase [Salipaludibacillus neizhouensis]|nr:pullulanase [Salipaludibacillus neizhouensis]